MEHERTFQNTGFQFALGIISINLIFPVIVHIGCGLIHGGSRNHAGCPRDQGGIIGFTNNGVLHTHGAFIVGQLAEAYHLKLLAHIIPHPLTEGRKQFSNGGFVGGATHSVEGIGFHLIQIGLISRILHTPIGAAGKGGGKQSQQGFLLF